MKSWSRGIALRLAMLLACGGCHQTQGGAEHQDVKAAWEALIGTGEDGGIIETGGGPAPGDGEGQSDGGSPPFCEPTSSEDSCDFVDNDCDGTIDEDCVYGPMQCPNGSNVIWGTSGDDVLIGTDQDDCILGYGGDDELWGMAGNDTLVGGPGDDSLIGHQGDDTLLGGDGSDQLSGGEGLDRLEGEAGNDFLEGGTEGDMLSGGACNDRLLDALGPDQLYGGPGFDRLVHADPGSSTISGGDGVDACDGTECEQDSHSFSCREDADCPDGMRCTAGSRMCVAEAAVLDGTCDGVDDDCDNHADEDYLPLATTCGVGQCASIGQTACSAGTVSDSCTPGTPGSSDDSCNGLDDNCDGQNDEGYPSASTSCGVGACASTGATSCSDGHVQDSCVPGTPASSDATCDGIDDDCDGIADEDYAPVATSCGVGACMSAGVTSCSGGSVHDSCVAGEPAASDATCNGIDEDCNGTNDEDYAPVATSCGVGACVAAGVTYCSGGSVQNSCTPGTPAASDATCNGVDDDCNGQNDEDYAPVVTSCGVGACTSTGLTSCSGGTVQNSCTPGTPGANDATCNGVDEDCNGQNDEDYVPVATSCGVGACASTGVTSCSGGSVQNSCAPGTPAANDTTCNGIDDDCNGQNDEDYVSLPTSCEVGGCSAVGSTSCVAASVIDSCPISPVCVAEINCGDALDNDGDGRSDCVDTDCASTPACAPQALSVSVGGKSNIWGAGHAAPPGDGLLPPISTLQYTVSGSTVTVSTVTGTVKATSAAAYGPDGLAGTWNAISSGGIAGYIHSTLARSLVGVFLGPSEPVDPAPARLTFPDGNFTSLAPAVGQMFFIGDGHTATSVLQTFSVPAGATRLALGLTDMCNATTIGCFNDNTGAWQVTAQVNPPPPVP